MLYRTAQTLLGRRSREHFDRRCRDARSLLSLEHWLSAQTRGLDAGTPTAERVPAVTKGTEKDRKGVTVLQAVTAAGVPIRS
jgi:hypothetical protein